MSAPLHQEADMTQELTAKQQYWAEQIKSAERSGISLAEYARQQNIPAHQLYHWRRTLRQVTTTEVTTKTRFSQVVSMDAGPVLSLHLAHATLRFRALPDADWLRRLLQSKPAGNDRRHSPQRLSRF